MRSSGILMHISSLPGPEGIGTLGEEAKAFIDFLSDAGMNLWQVLPVGPTGYGESPYQSYSSFAGNVLYISLAGLVTDGLLTMTRKDACLHAKGQKVDYQRLIPWKEALLRRSCKASYDKVKVEVDRFTRENPWVKDYALFMAIKQHFGGLPWTAWKVKGLRMRDKSALDKYEALLQADVQYHLYTQYLFRKQWRELKTYANGKGISLFGDMPIYVAEDSADTWTHPEVFQLNTRGIPKRVAGVPPDFFSEDGQLWGNPLYNWKYLEHTGYAWWVERMRGATELFDLIRIDHFIGFANYFSIPHGAPNARGGKWVIGPGQQLFEALREALPNLRIVAEDLGCVNSRVRKLLTWCGYPGMKVLSFGFGGDETSEHLPAQYTENMVVYTGTHDNDTVRGMLAGDRKALAKSKKWLGYSAIAEAPWAFIRAIMSSRANTAMVPMQDVLGLDGSARMNRPGTVGGNWQWRMKPGAATKVLAEKLNALNKATHRGRYHEAKP